MRETETFDVDGTAVRCGVGDVAAHTTFTLLYLRSFRRLTVSVPTTPAARARAQSTLRAAAPPTQTHTYRRHAGLTPRLCSLVHQKGPLALIDAVDRLPQDLVDRHEVLQGDGLTRRDANVFCRDQPQAADELRGALRR